MNYDNESIVFLSFHNVVDSVCTYTYAVRTYIYYIREQIVVAETQWPIPAIVLQLFLYPKIKSFYPNSTLFSVVNFEKR